LCFEDFKEEIFYNFKHNIFSQFKNLRYPEAVWNEPASLCFHNKEGN